MFKPARRRAGSRDGFLCTNESNYEQDQVNLQYTLFITRTRFLGNKIVQSINENVGKDATGSNHRERFIGLCGAPVTSYNGDKDAEKEKNGNSNLYSLVDFRGLNKLSSIHRAYMNGQFGALPNVIM